MEDQPPISDEPPMDEEPPMSEYAAKPMQIRVTDLPFTFYYSYYYFAFAPKITFSPAPSYSHPPTPHIVTPPPFPLFGWWLVSLRQYSSLKFPSFYPPPLAGQTKNPHCRHRTLMMTISTSSKPLLRVWLRWGGGHNFSIFTNPNAGVCGCTEGLAWALFCCYQPLSANRVDSGLSMFHEFPSFYPPPPG